MGAARPQPAKGKRRRLKAPKPTPVWLDRAQHVAALRNAGGELDQEARADRKVPRRATLATLVFAGLRIGELCELRWRDVDLSGGRITIRASKTDAGVRQIDMLPALRDELAALKANATSTEAGQYVFATMTGGSQNPSNLRNRVLSAAVGRVNEKLAEMGEVPLPERITPHKLRHTFASLLVALGVDPGSVTDQLGHTDPGFTLRVYRHGMRRDSASKTALRGLVGFDLGSGLGSSAAGDALDLMSTTVTAQRNPAISGISRMRPARFERATFRSGGGRSIP